MPDIHNIHFNAQREAAQTVLPDMLQTPEQLFGLLRNPRGIAGAAAEADGSRIENIGTAAAEKLNTETAARSYLQTLLENQGSEQLLDTRSRTLLNPSVPSFVYSPLLP